MGDDPGTAEPFPLLLSGAPQIAPLQQLFDAMLLQDGLG
jgi:hypothetical protein